MSQAARSKGVAGIVALAIGGGVVGYVLSQHPPLEPAGFILLAAAAMLGLANAAVGFTGQLLDTTLSDAKDAEAETLARLTRLIDVYRRATMRAWIIATVSAAVATATGSVVAFVQAYNEPATHRTAIDASVALTMGYSALAVVLIATAATAMSYHQVGRFRGELALELRREAQRKDSLVELQKGQPLRTLSPDDGFPIGSGRRAVS
jgi:hypothetical protein